MVKRLSAKQETQLRSLGREDSHRRKQHSIPPTLPGTSHDRGAWWATIHAVTTPLHQRCLGHPMTEEPGGLQSTWSQRVGHDLVTKQQQQKSNFPINESTLSDTQAGLAFGLSKPCFIFSLTPFKYQMT